MYNGNVRSTGDMRGLRILRRYAWQRMLKPTAVAMPLLVAITGAAQGQCETAKLLASDGAAGDLFGWSVGISGDLSISGGYFSSSAYIYRFNGATWIEQAVLEASDGMPSDSFATAVAISGDVAIVGAFADDDNGLFSGSAYVFRFDGAKWLEQAKLLASDGESSAWFGSSVAISNDVALVGAPVDGRGIGAAYVYRFDGATWIEEAKLLASDAAPTAFFGDAVAIDGNVAIAGAYGHDGNGNAAGAAYVFRFDGITWHEEAKLLDSQGSAFDNFGRSTAIRGDVAIVGAVLDDDNGGDSGSAFVYRFDGATWPQEAKLQASDGMDSHFFGGSVAIDGDVALVAALGDDENGLNAGAAYLYRLNGFTWIEEAKLLAADAAPLDTFGRRVAISDDRAIVGADKDDAGSGSAYVFAGLGGADCDSNGLTDACEILAGTSKDSNGDGVLDVCECPWDLQGDAIVGINDFLDMLAAWGTDPGGPPDFDGDGVVGILDFLELLANWGFCPVFLDCNGNAVFDPVDITNGSSIDCNGNGVPDECEGDCNGNGIDDTCDVLDGTSPDCNGNVVPDECDIAGGDSPDFNGNGVPDECEPVPNDVCVDAIPISDGATPFQTSGATTGGPLAICESTTTFVNDIWFLYTAPCTGTATFSVCNDADFDTLLALYFTGSCPPPLNPLACNDNAAGCGETSEIQLPVAAGFSYLVRLGGAAGGGSGTLTVTCEP